MLAERVCAISALGVPAWRWCRCRFGVWHTVADFLICITAAPGAGGDAKPVAGGGAAGCRDQNCADKILLPNLLVDDAARLKPQMLHSFGPWHAQEQTHSQTSSNYLCTNDWTIVATAMRALAS